jgi:mRNA interferase RelE/StbE
MAWRIEFAPAADKELGKLDRAVAQRIIGFLRERIAPLEDPRSLGQALKGSRLGDLWKYRVGDHRIICDIDDGVLVVLVLKVGHRGDVYR